MTLTKKTSDYGVRYFKKTSNSQSDQTQVNKPNTRKNVSTQAKGFSQNNKKILEDYISAEGFPILK